MKRNKEENKKSIYSRFLKWAVIIMVGVLFGFFIHIGRAAWSPSAVPPNNNRPEPLGIGQVGQEKTGSLRIGDTDIPSTVLDVWGKLRTTGGAILNTANALYGALIQYGNTGIGTTTPQEKLVLDGGNFLQTALNSPRHLSSISESSCPGCALTSPSDIFIFNKYAYIVNNNSGGGESGLEIMDISNPFVPAHVGLITNNTCLSCGFISPFAVYVSGNYAYIADSAGILIIIDISNSFQPKFAASFALSYSTRDIYVSGKYAYLVSFDINGGVEIVNISNPNKPIMEGSIFHNDCSGSGCLLRGAESIYISGKYAYVASVSSAGVEILDISNPAAPSHAGSISDASCGVRCSLGSPRAVYVSGKYAYVTSNDFNNVVRGGIEILDISNPSSPVHKGSIFDAECDLAVSGGCALNSPRDIVVVGKYAYVSSDSDDGVAVVDISDPSSPWHVNSIFYNQCTASGCALDYPWRIYLSGKYLYVGSLNSDGLEILDISGIDSPAANIGNISSNNITVTENMDIGNNLYVGSGVNIGSAGIKSDGPVQAGAIFASSTIQAAALSYDPVCNADLKGSIFYKTGSVSANCYCDGTGWKKINNNGACN